MGVFLSIRQHVDDGVTDRAGRRDRSGVISVCPHGAAASENAVHGAGNADREPAEPTGKATPCLGLNQPTQAIIRLLLGFRAMGGVRSIPWRRARAARPGVDRWTTFEAPLR